MISAVAGKSRGDNLFLVSTEPPELRVAELRDGQLFDFSVDRGGRLVGDIFKGRVENIVAGMDAAFVNIGLARNALVHSSDVVDPSSGVNEQVSPGATITQKLRAGDEVLVQIARPPIAAKGARATMQLSLAGRYCVLTTEADSVGVSRRMENEDERQRLRRLAEKLRPLDHGLIIRTEAEYAPDHEIARDVKALAEQMQAIRTRSQTAPTPSLIHREYGLLGRLVRDRFSQSTTQVIIDSPEVHAVIVSLSRLLAPDLERRATLYDEAQPLFEKYGVATDIALAQKRAVSLPSGGGLVIDEAEALCAIDINTAKFTGKKRLADTVLQTNLEAVVEATRQIRLRDIGGVIVIDFIDMERRRDSIKVLDALEAALKPDRARARIVQLSPSGLVEIIRRREGQSLRMMLHRPCPYCEGEGVIRSPQTVAIEARRRVRALAAKGASTLLVTLHPEAAYAFLGADAEWVRALELTSGARIQLYAEVGAHLETCRVEPSEPHPQVSWSSGTRLQIASNAPLLPYKEPQFVVHENFLLRLENSGEGALRRPSIVEITHDGDNRWYFTARVLVWHEASG
jgi:ribonuclease G